MITGCGSFSLTSSGTAAYRSFDPCRSTPTLNRRESSQHSNKTEAALTLKALEAAIQAHGGEFTCSQIHGKKRRAVAFTHVITPPVEVEGIPKFGKLRDFYTVFGSVRFYFDEASGESAKYLAPVDEWEELGDSFSAWLEDLDEDEREEIVPGWGRALHHTCDLPWVIARSSGGLRSSEAMMGTLPRRRYELDR
jgi:hypothetical protein